jgi:hypothetical protein
MTGEEEERLGTVFVGGFLLLYIYGHFFFVFNDDFINNTLRCESTEFNLHRPTTANKKSDERFASRHSGEDLAALFPHAHGVLELRRQPPVRRHHRVAVQVDFETKRWKKRKKEKPASHLIGSMVGNRVLASYGSTGFSSCKPTTVHPSRSTRVASVPSLPPGQGWCIPALFTLR